VHPGRLSIEEAGQPRRARHLLDREYARPLDVPAMAQRRVHSPSHFTQLFRAAYGESPYRYLSTRRVKRVKALLRRGDLSITRPTRPAALSCSMTTETRL
jgi:AraC-like DNA-binding protein